MHWYEFGLARSDISKWVTGPNKGRPFRLRDICDYDNRPEDTSETQLDNLMTIGMAHEVIADLLERDLIEPTVDRNKVERYQPLVAKRNKIKQWEKLIFPKGVARHAVISLWRGFTSWFWVFLIWFFTLVAGGAVKHALFD